MRGGYQEWPGAVAAIMLILAIFALPYGYYELLRWVVAAASVYVAYSMAESRDGKMWIFIVIAIIFNPIVPVYGTKIFWVVADLMAAGLFLSLSKRIVITKG